MEKIVKAHKDYYEFRSEFYTVRRKQSGIWLLMNDDMDSCLICDRHYNVLHEIILGGENSLAYLT